MTPKRPPKPALHTGNRVRKDSQTTPKRSPKSALHTGNCVRKDSQTSPKRSPKSVLYTGNRVRKGSRTGAKTRPGAFRYSIWSLQNQQKSSNFVFPYSVWPQKSGTKRPKTPKLASWHDAARLKNGLCRQVLRPSVIGAKHWFSQAPHSIGPK